MRAIIGVIGVFLIVFGIASYSHHGVNYTSREKIGQIGSLQLTADTQKTVTVHPAVSAAFGAAGIVLLIAVGMRRKNKPKSKTK